MTSRPPPPGIQPRSFDEHWPEDKEAATQRHRQGAFEIFSRKLPISKAGPIESMEKVLSIPVPEMIFGDNVVGIHHLPSGWRIEFSAQDALGRVDKTGENMLRVSYAGAWSASREQTSAGIREVVKPFDWSYSTDYKGSVVAPWEGSGGGGGGGGDGGSNENENPNHQAQTTNKPTFTPTDQPIPIELLKRRDPILFYDDVMLYESELDDNGISVLSVKVRVHEARMLLLCRLYMRLDDVVCRVRDTRVYVDFASEVVTREYTAKEAAFDQVKQKLLFSGLRPDAITVALRDANQIAEVLPIVEQTLESISLRSS
ncbi:TIP41-like family-domain-containing protein [Xylariaceae sp. FL0255]|nr:TIP41-like family-domain-containing protein [Xylariaceae sp. FL0255]